MSLVLTLIGESSKGAFDDALLGEMQTLGAQPQTLSAPDAPLTAIEWRLAKKSDVKSMRARMADLLGARPIDFAVQEAASREKRLLCIDMESTVIAEEYMDELAERLGVGDEVRAITERGMRGEVPFAAALDERLALLQGAPLALLENLAANKMTFHAGAEAMLRAMKARGVACFLATGGHRLFVERLVEKLPVFEGYLYNDWASEDGKLNGRLASAPSGGAEKAALLDKEAKAREIPRALTLAVGDGSNDIPMLQAAGLGVAYRAKPKVTQISDAAITHTDLRSILYFQGYADA